MRVVLGILLLGLALAGCGSATRQQDPHQLNSAASQPKDVENTYPIALRVPDIKLDQHGESWQALGIQGDIRDNSSPVPVTTKAGEIEVPPVSKPMQLGWYCPGGVGHCGAPIPGQIGPSVVVGHINGGGHDGVFARLAAKNTKGDYLIHPGSKIEVDRSDGQTFVYTVSELQVVPKDQFPTDKVYGDTPTPTLRLITCGPYNLDRQAHSYRDQTIVYAQLSDAHPTTG